MLDFGFAAGAGAGAGAAGRGAPAARENSSTGAASERPGKRSAPRGAGGRNMLSEGAAGAFIIRVNSPTPPGVDGSVGRGGPPWAGGAWNMRVNSPGPEGAAEGSGRG